MLKVTEIGMILQKLNLLHVIVSKKTAMFKFFCDPCRILWGGGGGGGGAGYHPNVG